jgi:hypothetical protein
VGLQQPQFTRFFGRFGKIAEDHFDKTFDTNVRGMLFAVAWYRSTSSSSRHGASSGVGPVSGLFWWTAGMTENPKGNLTPRITCTSHIHEGMAPQ